MGAVTTTTSMSTTQYIPLMDSSGNMTKITRANLLSSLLNGYNVAQMNTGVFIVYESATTHMRFRSPERYPSSYDPIGILLVSGSVNLIISLDEPSADTMNWNSATGLCDTAVSATKSAVQDFSGKSKTATIMASSNYESSNPSSYAVGYCHNYSKFSTYGGYGLAAGTWWLPSLGELLLIYANIASINNALTKAGGTALSTSAYWSSTEASATNAYAMYFSDGTMSGNNKSSVSARVRPVSCIQSLTSQS